MTTDELRAAAGELVRLNERFAPLFGRKEAQAHSLVYLNGLLLSQDRKSAEPMALVFGAADDENGIGQNQVLGLQRFLTHSRWDFQDVQREIQSVFAEELVPSTATWSIGTVGVIDGHVEYLKIRNFNVEVRNRPGRLWCVPGNRTGDGP